MVGIIFFRLVFICYIPFCLSNSLYLINISFASLLMNIALPWSTRSTAGKHLECTAHPLSYNANTMFAMSSNSPFSKLVLKYKSIHYHNSLDPSPATANAHIKLANSLV